MYNKGGFNWLNLIIPFIRKYNPKIYPEEGFIKSSGVLNISGELFFFK